MHLVWTLLKFLPESVRLELHELEEYRQGRGGKRPCVEKHDPSVDIHIAHENITRKLQIQTEDTIEIAHEG